MPTFDLRSIRSSIDLPNGNRVLLIDWSTEDIDANRNVFCLSGDGALVWQVKSDYDNDESGPFTGIRFADARLTAARWIGLLYEIDPMTGFGVVIAETR